MNAFSLERKWEINMQPTLRRTMDTSVEKLNAWEFGPNLGILPTCQITLEMAMGTGDQELND